MDNDASRYSAVTELVEYRAVRQVLVIPVRLGEVGIGVTGSQVGDRQARDLLSLFDVVRRLRPTLTSHHQFHDCLFPTP